MNSLIYSFSVFVLLLLINITYNLNINNALDSSIFEIEDDKNSQFKRQASRNLNETHIQLCNKTYSDKFGGLGGLTSIDKTGSELNGGGMNSTDYTYKNETDSTSGGCFLRFTSFVNNSEPVCKVFSCGGVTF